MKEDRKPNYAPLFVIGCQIYSNIDIARPRHTPLTIDNNFPSIHIRFGSTQNHSEISFASHWLLHCHECSQYQNQSIVHYCTSINILSLHSIQLQKNIDTTQLNCAVEDYEKINDTYGKLTSLVVYNPNYFYPSYTKRIQIEFGLGKEVAVSAIIGIPTFKKWKSSINF